MQRKELKKAIKNFSNRTNFYKLGLVRRYLKEQEREEQELIKAVPKVICPHCGSTGISIEYDERDYSSDSWLYCNNCDESFGDTFGFIDATEELKCLPWSDHISVELHFEEPNIKSYKWQEFCEKEIKKYLRIIKEDKLDIF